MSVYPSITLNVLSSIYSNNTVVLVPDSLARMDPAL